MPFSEDQRAQINRNILELSQNTTDFEQVSARLLVSNIISEPERQRLINKGKNDDDYSRNFDFYNLIVKKDSRGYEILLDALEKTGQKDLADKIKDRSDMQKNKPQTSRPNPVAMTESDESSDEDEDDLDIASKTGMTRTKENILMLRAAFDKFDTSGDGNISEEEFFELMKQFGYSRKGSQKLLQANDADGDGNIDFLEFISIFLPA